MEKNNKSVKEKIFTIKLDTKDILDIKVMVDATVLLGVHRQDPNLIETSAGNMRLLNNIKKQVSNQIDKAKKVKK